MLIIPAIDLRGGRCVRLTQGRREDAKVYDGDPLEIALAFEAEGARMIHVVDLDGAFEETESPNRRIARSIIEAVSVPIQFGGGLRAAADARLILGWGAERVVLGTLAVESPDILTELVEEFGARIAVGIDARDGKVVTRGWEKREGVSAVELARRVGAAGVSRIIYTDVARDGTFGGINVEQTCAVAVAASVPVTASGGVSSAADIERLKAVEELGIDSVIVGKALYEGRLTLAEIM